MKTMNIRYRALLLLCILAVLPVYAQRAHTLTMLQTSDVHSRIEPMDAKDGKYADLGGFVRRATLVEQYRKEIPGLLLIDCGDFSQGTPYYNFYKGELEIKLMNLMKYDVATIGNHEFDFGLENLARLYRMANFPVVCSNYDVTGSVLEGIVKPYAVIQRDGIKIGFFGLAPKLEGLVQADKYETLVYRDPVKVANEMATTLKKKEKCDVVICLSHLGVYEDEAMIPQTRGIDFIWGGHTHTFMDVPAIYLDKDGKSVPLFHSGKNGLYVARADLMFEKTNMINTPKNY